MEVDIDVLKRVMEVRGLVDKWEMFSNASAVDGDVYLHISDSERHRTVTVKVTLEDDSYQLWSNGLKEYSQPTSTFVGRFKNAKSVTTRIRDLLGRE